MVPERRAGLNTRRAWVTLTSLALLVALYAVLLLLVPPARPPFLRERAATLPLAVIAHLAGGTLALALGPFQLSDRFRSGRIQRHRVLGHVYLSSVLVGGVAGLRLAAVSQGGWVAHAGFATLGGLWLATGLAAYLAIRRGRRERHRAWMYRNFSLTFAAVTLRLYLPLSGVLGFPFAAAYPAIAWLCWLPNLIVTELRWVPARSRAAQSA